MFWRLISWPTRAFSTARLPSTRMGHSKLVDLA
jgi:hypothetical protein